MRVAFLDMKDPKSSCPPDLHMKINHSYECAGHKGQQVAAPQPTTQHILQLASQLGTV